MRPGRVVDALVGRRVHVVADDRRAGHRQLQARRAAAGCSARYSRIRSTASRVFLDRYVPLSETIVSTAWPGPSAARADQPRADDRRPVGVDLLDAEARARPRLNL